MPPGTPAAVQSIARDGSMMPDQAAALNGRAESREQKADSPMIQTVFLISDI